MNQEREAVALPEALPGHWDTAEGREMAMRYAAVDRPAVRLGSDLHLANAAFMELHEPLATATKERMRWLSVQLAMAQAEVNYLRSGGEGWRPEDGGWSKVRRAFGDDVCELAVPGRTVEGQRISLRFEDGHTLTVVGDTVEEAWSKLWALAPSPSIQGAG